MIIAALRTLTYYCHIVETCNEDSIDRIGKELRRGSANKSSPGRVKVQCKARSTFVAKQYNNHMVCLLTDRFKILVWLWVIETVGYTLD
jgi:hypothetical protein